MHPHRNNQIVCIEINDLKSRILVQGSCFWTLEDNTKGILFICFSDTFYRILKLEVFILVVAEMLEYNYLLVTFN